MRPGVDERGSASLMVATCLALLLTIGAATGMVAAVFRAHRAAQSAADLAALAGAAAGQRGDDGCVAADRFASANGAVLVSCRLDGDDVVVRAFGDGDQGAVDHCLQPAQGHRRGEEVSTPETSPLDAGEGRSGGVEGGGGGHGLILSNNCSKWNCLS